jgi:hypothetical protein
MFAHDLYHSQINILGMLSTYIEKTERSDTTNLQSSIFNRQYSIPACPGWVSMLYNYLGRRVHFFHHQDIG